MTDSDRRHDAVPQHRTPGTYRIETTDGLAEIEETTECDGCGAAVRIDVDGIAYEKNAHGTFVRHTCPEVRA